MTDQLRSRLPKAAHDLLDRLDGRASEWRTASALAMFAMNAGLNEDEFVTVVSSSDFAWDFATENGRDRSDRLESRLRKAWRSAEDDWQPPLAGDVRAKLAALSERVSTYRFPGRSVATDRAIAQALLGFAHELNKFTVDVSTRELSLRAGVGRTTVSRSLSRLRDTGLIRRDESAYGNAGRWVVSLEWSGDKPGHTVSPATESRGGSVKVGHTGLSPHRDNRMSQFVTTPHPAFYAAALGNSAGAVWWSLVVAEGERLTVREIAARTGITERTVRRSLERLSGERLTEKIDGKPATYAGVNVDAETLDRIADEYGTLDWTERSAERYDAERRGFIELARQREEAAAADSERRALEELEAV